MFILIHHINIKIVCPALGSGNVEKLANHKVPSSSLNRVDRCAKQSKLSWVTSVMVTHSSFYRGQQNQDTWQEGDISYKQK